MIDLEIEKNGKPTSSLKRVIFQISNESSFDIRRRTNKKIKLKFIMMANQKLRSINLVCFLIVVLAIVGHEAQTKKPNFMSKLFKSKATVATAAPINVVTNNRAHKLHESLVSALQSQIPLKELQLLRDLGLLVRQQSAQSDQPSKPVVVKVLANILGGSDQMRESSASFDTLFREKILRPCKLVHFYPAQPWWIGLYRQAGLSQIEDEWPTIKSVCKLIVLNVDSSRADLIKDTCDAIHNNKLHASPIEPISPKDDWSTADSRKLVDDEDRNSELEISSLEALMSQKDRETLGHLRRYVQLWTASSTLVDVEKSMVIEALASVARDPQELPTFGNFSAQFRDKFLRPCKVVQFQLASQWWESIHPQVKLSWPEYGWLTIKQICKVIVLNVDTNGGGRDIIEDTYKSTYASRLYKLVSDRHRPAARGGEGLV